MDKPAKPNWLIILVSAIFLLPPAASIYQLLVVSGDQPPWVGFAGAGGIDLLMVMAGFWALQLAEEGVATWPANLAMVLLASVSITVQLWHAALEGTLLTGVVLAALAVFGVLMIEGQLRRVHRLNARRDGRLAQPRPRMSIEQRWFFPRESRLADRLAVANPNSTADSVFKRAMAITAEMDKPKKPQERETIDPFATLPGLPVVESGSAPDSIRIESGSSPDPSVVVDVTDLPVSGPSGSVSALVKSLMAAGVTDPLRIISGVNAQYPDARPDTIRTYIRKFQKESA